MCSCGCNTCETKGPLLTEGKVKSLLSEGLQYHIDKKIPLFETVYRIGSNKHLALIREARKMYSRNIIDLCEDDEALIKTHLGEFGIYEGESVPLDLPMLDESYNPDQEQQDDEEDHGVGYDDDGRPLGETQNSLLKQSKLSSSEYQKAKKLKDLEKSLNEANKISDDKLMKLIPKMPKGYVGKNTGIGEYTISTPDGEDIVLTQSKDKKNWFYEPSNVALKILNEEKKLTYNDFVQMTRDDMMAGAAPDEYPSNERVRKDAKYYYNRYLQGASVDDLFEAEFRGKDVKLNKPKRGGSKAYYVYVRDPKTKKIKKVSFGSGGLRAKIKNKQARNAFAKRHNCKNKKDRTKAGYWSYNLPRYAPALGLGAKMNTFW